MERLTIKYEGLFTPKKACTIDRFGEADDCDSCDVICDSTHGSDCANCIIQECFSRLGDYEDTGLTPEQIRELKERDTEYFCKTSMFDHESVVCKCGNDIEKDSGFKFCPYCGHRIKLED